MSRDAWIVVAMAVLLVWLLLRAREEVTSDIHYD